MLELDFSFGSVMIRDQGVLVLSRVATTFPMVSLLLMTPKA